VSDAGQPGPEQPEQSDDIALTGNSEIPDPHGLRFPHPADPWSAWIRRAEALAYEGGHIVRPAWLRKTQGEPRWPVTLSVIAAIVLQFLLPPRLTKPLPSWLLPALELALLAGLTIANPVRIERRSSLLRTASLALIVLMTFANAASAVLLVRAILEGKAGDTAGPLLASGASIWATNVIAFSLWYWEFDRGGPVSRALGTRRHPDLSFPQMVSPELAPPDWEPHFVDYLYLSFTNATAFSPTDVMPLARWAKMTMLVQSAVSLAVAALVIARAVNILR
jgi:uncharacterized membrane protein